MVGFEPTKENSLPKLAYGAAGASSGIITRVVAQPLDVLKIRFQVKVALLTLLTAHYIH